MKTVQISLNSIDKVKSFVNDISKFDFDFDLVSGRYVIDAKSIMGIFSLDLSKPIDLNVHADGDALQTVLDVLAPYIRAAHSPRLFFCLCLSSGPDLVFQNPQNKIRPFLFFKASFP